jgi:hypothetical protein
MLTAFLPRCVSCNPFFSFFSFSCFSISVALAGKIEGNAKNNSRHSFYACRWFIPREMRFCLRRLRDCVLLPPFAACKLPDASLFQSAVLSGELPVEMP